MRAELDELTHDLLSSDEKIHRSNVEWMACFMSKIGEMSEALHGAADALSRAGRHSEAEAARRPTMGAALGRLTPGEARESDLASQLRVLFWRQLCDVLDELIPEDEDAGLIGWRTSYDEAGDVYNAIRKLAGVAAAAAAPAPAVGLEETLRPTPPQTPTPCAACGRTVHPALADQPHSFIQWKADPSAPPVLVCSNECSRELSRRAYEALLARSVAKHLEESQTVCERRHEAEDEENDT